MTRLTSAEMAIWQACKVLGERVTRRVAADIAAESGLSGTDFGVLARVADLGGGRLRQRALAESMQLHKGAMSHQLTRMEDRGLIRRERDGNGVEVVLTYEGTLALHRLRPVHAAAVRKHLIDRLSPADQAALQRIAAALADADD
jgi:DNA-binding MarR family transcriptional regulator